MNSWNQYHANNANQSSIPIHTVVVNKPKWSLKVGTVGYGSPIIDIHGIVYIGTLYGELIAVDPHGNLKWKRSITTAGTADNPELITGTPAIGNDGNIYVITTTDVTRKDRRSDSSKIILVRRSMLHSFTSSGNQRWSFRFPTIQQGIGGYTSASPKLWGSQNIFIFIPVTYEGSTNKLEIMVVNQSGNLVNKTEVSTHIASKISSWELMKHPADFANIPYGWPEPTLAIADFGSYNPQPIIVIENNYKILSAFKWNFPVLTPLWSHASEQARKQTSPAIFDNDEIFLANEKGVISCYDLKSGAEKRQPWPNIERPIFNSPILHKNHIYIVADNEIMMLNKNFQIVRSQSLPDYCRGAIALSANHIYICTEEGLYILSLDLTILCIVTEIAGTTSTPAIGPDGTLYIVDDKGVLFAL